VQDERVGAGRGARLEDPLVQLRRPPARDEGGLAGREVGLHGERRVGQEHGVGVLALLLGILRGHAGRTIHGGSPRASSAGRARLARMTQPEVRPRASWDEYFMSIAQVVATRSTCPRKYVGSAIVKNRTILSTGYNGSIRGMPHCSEVGHMMEDGHCV